MKALRILAIGAACCLEVGAFSDAHGQRRLVRSSPEVGIRAGRDFFTDSWTGGGHFRIPVARTIELRPSADFSLSDPGEEYQINGDIALRGPQDQAYLGAGIGYVHHRFGPEDEGATGTNIFVGFKPIPRPGTKLYVEGRWTFVHSKTFFRLGFGLAIPL